MASHWSEWPVIILKVYKHAGEGGKFWWKCKLVQLLWRTVWRRLRKLKIELLCMHSNFLQLCLTLCNPMDCKVPLSMGFSRQEYWSGLSCPSPGDLIPDPGIEPAFLMFPALAGGFFTTNATWSYMTQQFHSWAYIQRKTTLWKDTSLQHCLQ